MSRRAVVGAIVLAVSAAWPASVPSLYWEKIEPPPEKTSDMGRVGNTLFALAGRSLYLTSRGSSRWDSSLAVPGAGYRIVAADGNVHLCPPLAAKGPILRYGSGAAWEEVPFPLRESMMQVWHEGSAWFAMTVRSGSPEPYLLHISRDSLRTWIPLDSVDFRCLATARGDQLFYATGTKARMSTDGGLTWKAVRSPWAGVGGFGGRMIFVGDRMLALLDGQLRESRDSGSSWENLAVDWSGPVNILTTDGKDFFAKVSDGLYMSGDGGRSWVPEYTGLLYPEFLSIRGNDSLFFTVGGDGKLWIAAHAQGPSHARHREAPSRHFLPAWRGSRLMFRLAAPARIVWAGYNPAGRLLFRKSTPVLFPGEHKLDPVPAGGPGFIRLEAEYLSGERRSAVLPRPVNP